jgi:hypothetical protein
MKYIMAYLPYGCNIFEAPFEHGKTQRKAQFKA